MRWSPAASFSCWAASKCDWSAIVQSPQRRRDGPVDGDPGRHRRSCGLPRPSYAPSRAGRTPSAEQRSDDARSGVVGAWQIIASTSLPILGTFGVLAIAGGAGAPNRRRRLCRLQRRVRQFTAAILDLAIVDELGHRGGAASSPVSVRCSRRRSRSRQGGSTPVRSADMSRFATCGSAIRPDGPWTLEDIDFEVRPGASIAVVGVSGSGKSALLRLLLGFETPERGGVYYDDKDLETLDLRARCAVRSARSWKSAGLIPGSHLREHRRRRPADAGSGRWKPIRLAGLDADIAADADGPRNLRDGRRRSALGRPAPARDDRARPRQPAAADLPRRGDQRARQPYPGDRRREPGEDERHAHRHRPSAEHHP